MLADRLKEIKPFRVMEVLARAGELEAAGHDVLHFEVGEPDFPTAQPVKDAGVKAIESGFTKYTEATGIFELRQEIANYYANIGVVVDPRQVVVTSGASGGLIMLSALLLNPGDEMLITDPGYPCNEVFVHLCGGVPRPLTVGPNTRFQPTAEDVQAAWTAKTRGVLLASPGNPTGTSIAPEELKKITEVVRDRSGFTILDEIYHGIRHSGPITTGLEVDSELFVLNSFSKYFGMTGWRLGWVVVPTEYVGAATKLCQNLFICPSTPSQHAALAAFGEEATAINEARVEAFGRRCRTLYDGLCELGFQVPVYPDGAFYLYVDVSHTGLLSQEFCRRLLDEFYVAVTPGADFGSHLSDKYVRFAFTTSDEAIEKGLARIAEALKAWGIV
ncbi:MAG: aspartate/methionine/tyrosine aminotransferase [Limisphaerales bacterium]|jgi:aspartate/methionine/tyrosine aminotransferase